jgi:hypothetical protein
VAAVAETAVLTDMVPVVAVGLGQEMAQLHSLTQFKAVVLQPILAVGAVAEVDSAALAVLADLAL